MSPTVSTVIPARWPIPTEGMSAAMEWRGREVAAQRLAVPMTLALDVQVSTQPPLHPNVNKRGRYRNTVPA